MTFMGIVDEMNVINRKNNCFYDQNTHKKYHVVIEIRIGGT